MTHLAPNPVKHNFLIPSSLAILTNLDIIGPFPPAPALLTLDNKVSAGWEMIAAATPAITPDNKEIEILVPFPNYSGYFPIEL